jgi:glycosyltransferase involved in cell wall biosynthesis
MPSSTFDGDREIRPAASPMTGRPRVSVVIIFLNAEPFLGEAVESVFAQTYRAWELLLVDDGSTDASSTIARHYAETTRGRVRYLTHAQRANRGMSASRNLGVQHASGEYVAFLDADDVWLPRILEDQVAILETHANAAMVYGPLQYWFSWTGDADDRTRDRVEGLGVPPDTIVHPPRLLPLFLQDRAAVPSGVLVRRTAITAVGGFDEAFRGEYEDQVFCAKICATRPVFASGRSWYRYRQHRGSCVAEGLRTGATLEARVTFLRWLRGYLLQQRMTDAAVWWALHEELWRLTHPLLWRAVVYGHRLASRVRRSVRRREEIIGEIVVKSGTRSKDGP